MTWTLPPIGALPALTACWTDTTLHTSSTATFIGIMAPHIPQVTRLDSTTVINAFDHYVFEY